MSGDRDTWEVCMSFFPLFIELHGKEILVVGGGRIAGRRIEALLPFGCRIHVVSPDLSEGLMRRQTEGQLRWSRRTYGVSVLETEQPFFFLAAAGREVNETVVNDCRAAGIPVNDASCRENCDFYFPGIVKEGETVVGITAGGRDHKLAAALSGLVRRFMKETWKA